MNAVAVFGTMAAELAVVTKATRRRFSAAYKLKVLLDAGVWARPGKISVALRLEGLYFSDLTTRRERRRIGEVCGLTPKKRGLARQGKNTRWSQGGGFGSGGDPVQCPDGAGRRLVELKTSCVVPVLICHIIQFVWRSGGDGRGVR